MKLSNAAWSPCRSPAGRMGDERMAAAEYANYATTGLTRGHARGAERQHARRAPTFCCLASSTRRDACGAIMVKAPLLCTRGGAGGTGALSPPGRRHAGSSRLPPEEPFSSPFRCAPLSRCMVLARSVQVRVPARRRPRTGVYHELACSTLSRECAWQRRDAKGTAGRRERANAGLQRARGSPRPARVASLCSAPSADKGTHAHTPPPRFRDRMTARRRP